MKSDSSPGARSFIEKKHEAKIKETSARHRPMPKNRNPQKYQKPQEKNVLREGQFSEKGKAVGKSRRKNTGTRKSQTGTWWSPPDKKGELSYKVGKKFKGQKHSGKNASGQKHSGKTSRKKHSNRRNSRNK